MLTVLKCLHFNYHIHLLTVNTVILEAHDIPHSSLTEGVWLTKYIIKVKILFPHHHITVTQFPLHVTHNVPASCIMLMDVLTPLMWGIPALHSTQQACWISSLAASPSPSAYAAWIFSRVGEGTSGEPWPGSPISDALAPISAPGPGGAEDIRVKRVLVRRRGKTWRFVAVGQPWRMNTLYDCTPVSSVCPQLGHLIKERSHGMKRTAAWIRAHYILSTSFPCPLPDWCLY